MPAAAPAANPAKTSNPPSARHSNARPVRLSAPPSAGARKAESLVGDAPAKEDSASSPSRALSMDDSCVVCAEPLHFCALMDCGHRGCCSMCASRLKLLMGDDKCVLCKRVPSKVYVIPASDRRTYSAIAGQNWGERTSGFTHDETTGFFFADAVGGHLAKLRQLREPRCEVCKRNFPTVDELKKHLTTEHRLFICPLCLQFGGRFLRELPLMTRNQLSHHYKSGDANSAFAGHPTCRFCSDLAFYDDTALYKHLKETHESCFICARLGSRFQYFDNFAALNTHFASDHFMCPDPKCIASRFSVFASELELSAHFASEHPSRVDSRSFAMPFVVRGSREDQAASAPPPSSQSVPAPEDFPALAPSHGGHALSSASWSSRQPVPSAPRLTSSDFPAIAPARSSGTAASTVGRDASGVAVARDAFPSLPQRPKRASAVERFEQWNALNRAKQEASRDSSRGPRQDAMLLRAREAGEEEEDEDGTQGGGGRKPKGKKPPGRNTKQNMYGMLQ